LISTNIGVIPEKGEKKMTKDQNLFVPTLENEREETAPQVLAHDRE
jgi:hypothetical protein